MFEYRTSPLLPWRIFLRRLVLSTVLGLSLVVLSLFVGMLGYHHYEKLSWVDAFVNAAMILSGMGPLSPLQTTQGKIFAGLYALYSGLVLIIIAGIIFAPVVHRFLHKFHLEQRGGVNSGS
ncbi:MAG: hypothetical protein ACREUY_07160 [Burkholderiales bacterium]